MQLGLSTYSFFWQISKNNPNALTLEDIIKETKAYGLNLLQICDFPELETYSDEKLIEVSNIAKEHGVKLEVGTRGISFSKLTEYLKICNLLESKTLRTMLNDASFEPSQDEAIQLLKEMTPAYEQKGIQISLETYEQRKTAELIEIIKEVDSQFLGICLDPANCIANLELPEDVMKLSAPYVNNLHLKDFKFTRKDGWVGFSLVGTSFGEGQLDATLMLEILNERHKKPNAIIEFWLPLQETMEETVQLEKQWIEKSIGNISDLFSKQ
ncbi:sugar phosphate isomerase/epimerase [Psychrobacillus sp. INOP01]|uniref:sugar phosphate isomerase/epimerase family protein n=1 Tax=Psychrobacillus sp. INOP01 TaxID=2829187 RepID=UPI001BAA6688|nr:TIM barrel protein [Psychrobacillus sp. INOP01]QUG42595.1 sugar phosphate isomerase/epimerase [Psychrobacillus sp. INOP01]